MLSKCPRQYSCGANIPYWTDEPMPTAIGIPTRVTAYASLSWDYNDACKYFNIQIEVMRCSLTDHDFIYRHPDVNDYNGTCWATFCGMK